MNANTSPTRAFRRALAVVALCAVFAGCSLVGLGYGHLDTIASWMVDEYFDLEPAQKTEFNRRFERLHAWHRYEQLPEYVVFLGSARARLQQGLKPEDVAWIAEGVKARARTMVRHASADAAELLATLTPQQLEALQQQWDKDNRRFMREYRLDGTAEDRLRARTRRSLTQIKDWVGSLTYEQEQKIVALVRELPSIDALRHEDRLRRQKEFLRLLELRGNRQAFAPRLAHWMQHWEEGRAPEYDRRLTEWWEKRIAFFITVDRMLAPHQRATAAQRVQKYIDDFKRLSDRETRAAAP